MLLWNSLETVINSRPCGGLWSLQEVWPFTVVVLMLNDHDSMRFSAHMALSSAGRPMKLKFGGIMKVSS